MIVTSACPRAGIAGNAFEIGALSRAPAAILKILRPRLSRDGGSFVLGDSRFGAVDSERCVGRRCRSRRRTIYWNAAFYPHHRRCRHHRAVGQLRRSRSRAYLVEYSTFADSRVVGARDVPFTNSSTRRSAVASSASSAATSTHGNAISLPLSPLAVEEKG